MQQFVFLFLIFSEIIILWTLWLREKKQNKNLFTEEKSHWFYVLQVCRMSFYFFYLMAFRFRGPFWVEENKLFNIERAASSQTLLVDE